MLVLVASGDQSPAAPEQLATTIAGELVIPIDSCACVAPCRCRRSWFGIASGGSTATAVVADRVGVDAAGFRGVVADQLARAMSGPVSDADVDATLRMIESVTGQFASGARLARVGDHVTEVHLAVSEHE